jgi:Flp pilus assembly protein TadG
MSYGSRISRRKAESAEGASLIELALVIPVFLMIFVGAVDLGRAFYVAIEVTAAAHAGALYGIENPNDVSGMESAASAGAPSLSGLGTSASYGCECSDGTSSVESCTSAPDCTYNYVNYVDVVATARYVPSIEYPGIPSSITFTREARMRVGGD